MKEKLRIALLWGGRGLESRVSARGKAHILPILQKICHTYPIFIDKEGRWLYGGRRLFPADGDLIFENGERTEIDAALPLLHGDYGEDGIVQGALENARIPYIGCDTVASAVCRDKAFVKAVAAGLGIPALPHLTVYRGEGRDLAARLCEASFSYPVFIKPARLGSSVGVSAAENREGLFDGLSTAFSLCERVIIEPYLAKKRELECGYFSDGRREIFSHPGEVLIDGVYDYEGKYTGDTRLSVRADIDGETARLIRDCSRRLVRALGIRHLSRIDYFLSDGELYLNEINTMPGFTDGSLYARMIEAEGIPESELLSRLITAAVKG